MRIFTLCFMLVMLSSAAFAQVDIDKSINLSGGPGNARISGIKDVVGPQDALSVEAFQKGSFVYAGTSTGAGTLGSPYAVSLTPGITTYATALLLYFKANAACGTGPVYINVNSQGAKVIKKNDGQDLAANDILANQVVSVIYDGTNFNMLSLTGGSSDTPQTLSASGTGSIDLSDGGGSVVLQGTGTTSVSRSGNTITINSTDGDASTTNEIQTISASGANQIDLSNGGGSVNIAGAGISAVSRSGNTLTVTSTEVDGSTTNEIQSISAAGNNITLSNGGGSVTLAGSGATSVSTSGSTITISSTDNQGVTGTGTQNYVTKWNNGGGTTIGNSQLYDNGTSVGIGTTGPAASSALDITSTTKGFLPPRMTTAQRNAIASPVAGLTIYNTTTGCLNYYIGTNWVAVCGTTLGAGGTVTDVGGYRIHTFTSNGTFKVNTNGTVEVLVVAGGGGGGGGQYHGGGGGGGGVLYNASYAVTAGQEIAVTVGTGGAGGTHTRGTNGTNSIFGTLTAIGGGGGVNNNAAGNGGIGGSGGGGSYNRPPGSGTPGQGFAGGTGTSGGVYGCGGGGGAGGAGSNGTTSAGGAGGTGVQYSISGSPKWYGGGGGGSVYSASSSLISGGAGGSGVGGAGSSGNGGNGVANTGGGGGGGERVGSKGGNGANGIVIVRYQL